MEWKWSFKLNSIIERAHKLKLSTSFLTKSLLEFPKGNPLSDNGHIVDFDDNKNSMDTRLVPLFTKINKFFVHSIHCILSRTYTR